MQKGKEIGDGWRQLTAIKNAIVNLNYFERRKFKKIISPLEHRLKQLEDGFISQVELDLVLII